MNFYLQDLQKGLVVPGCIATNNRLSLGSKWLYAVLARLCVRGNSRQCFPSQKYLAERIGVSVRSIQNYLRELEKSGFITIRAGRDGETNTYNLSRPAAVQKNYPTPGAESTPVCKEEERRNTPPTPHRGADVVGRPAPAWKAEAESAFERLWETWPVKEARTRALRWWMRLWRLRLLPSLEKLLHSLRDNLARNPRWQRGFIPYLSNWLSGRRWEDALQDLTNAPGKVASTPTGQVERERQKAFGRQGEEAGTRPLGSPDVRPDAPPASRAAASQGADDKQLGDILSIWPGSLTDAAISRVKGLWMYLRSRNRLPASDVLLSAAKTETQNFSRWLHAYYQKIHEGQFDSPQIHEATGTCAH